MPKLATLQRENKKSEPMPTRSILLLINCVVACPSPMSIGYAKAYEKQTAKHGIFYPIYGY